MTKSGHLLRTTQILPLFLARVREAGGDVDALMQRFGLPPGSDRTESVLFPLPAFWELSDAAAEAARDPELGVTTAVGAVRGAYGLWEYLGRNALTLGEALQRFVHYRSLSESHVQYSLEVHKGEAVYRFRVPGHPLGLGRHGNEFSIAMMHRLACDCVGQRLQARRAWFTHPKPKGTAALTQALGVTPRFDAGENGIAFDRAVLELPVKSADPALHSLIARQLEARLAVAAPNFIALVEQQVQLAIQQGQRPAVERIAERLHMSGRTLQRRLLESDTSFSAVIDEARKRIASTLVAEGKMTLGEIAYVLGYADVTPFARAFKRWTGKTPQEIRRERE